MGRSSSVQLDKTLDNPLTCWCGSDQCRITGVQVIRPFRQDSMESILPGRLGCPQTGKIPGVDDVPNVWITSVLFPLDFMGKCPTLWAEQTLQAGPGKVQVIHNLRVSYPHSGYWMQDYRAVWWHSSPGRSLLARPDSREGAAVARGPEWPICASQAVRHCRHCR